VAFTSEAIVPGKAELTNSLGMKLVWIPPGRFCLGSADLADDIQGDEKPHRVCITRPFYLAVHEVTVGQFRRFVEATGYSTDAERSERYKGLLAMPPDLFNEKSRLAWYDPPFPQAETSPVVYVSWSDAQAFVAWLGSLEGRDYRLPSEAEWEYACRAGSTTRFSTGDDEETLRRSANVRDGGAWRPRGLPRDGFRFASPVGSFPANSFGLCDMHGNVWEWCADWYRADYYHESLPADPPGPAKGSERVLRGGSYFLSPDSSRSANRASNPPDFYSYEVGFRVALTPD
jgi:formylglycine-generating enzyme required for sulfatase activity